MEMSGVPQPLKDKTKELKGMLVPIKLLTYFHIWYGFIIAILNESVVYFVFLLSKLNVQT